MIVACSACNHRFEGGGYRDEKCPACGALALATRSCPRCTSPLAARRIGDLVLDECPRCAGVYVDHATIERAVSEHADELLAALPPPAALGEHPAAAPMCPTCGMQMAKRMASGGSGVIIDVCNPHGVFFDSGELQRLVAVARREAERAVREGHERGDTHAWPGSSDDVGLPAVAAAGGIVAVSLLAGPLGLVAAKLILAAIGGAAAALEHDR